jgi:hypothetical protein
MRKDSKRTVSTWLNRRLNVANALDRNAVLVIAVDILVLQFADLIEKHAELVSDIRDILVAGLAPNGQLLL